MTTLRSLLREAPRRHVLEERLLKKYESERAAIDAVLSEPYRSCLSIAGIGWYSADAVARTIGIDADHPDRMAASVTESMRRQETFGHCWHTPGGLSDAMVALTATPYHAVHAAIQIAVDRERIITHDGERLYSGSLYRAETRVIDAIIRLAGARDLRGCLSLPPIAEIERTITHHRDQAEALWCVKEVGFSVITGAPGTGKTYMLKALLDRFEGSVELCAPTGKATKRLAELTGRKSAQTIHRLLQPRFDGVRFEFARERVDPDLLVVDEASMLSLNLAASLLSRVATGTRVVFIGDPYQLPAVGPGDVLRDIIRSGAITVARLDKIKRQDPGAIVLACHDVLHGVTPEMPEPGSGDLAFIDAREASKAAAAARGLLDNRAMRAKYGGEDDYSGIQIISPRRKPGSPVSCTDFNLLMTDGRTMYAPGDKVMQTKNSYELGIFNGDCGRVVKCHKRSMTVDFAGVGEVKGARSKFSLDFAWATTVHKFQGSEAPVIIMLIHDAAGPMLLTRTLFYTALSRARKLCVIVGTESAISRSIANDKDEKRRTGLADRLREAVIMKREMVEGVTEEVQP